MTKQWEGLQWRSTPEIEHCLSESYHSHAFPFACTSSSPPTLTPSLYHQTELDAHLDTLTDKAECGEAWTKFSDDIVSEDFEKLSLEEQTKVRHRKESHVGTEGCKEGRTELDFARPSYAHRRLLSPSMYALHFYFNPPLNASSFHHLLPTSTSSHTRFPPPPFSPSPSFQALDTFCQTPCGPSFNKAAADWRDWCNNNEEAFVPIGNDDDVTYTFDGFVAEFGCSKSAGNESQYCAKIIMDEMNSEPQDMAPKCAYYSSCCFGEMHRMVKLGDMAQRTVSLEEKCPGTREALASKCAA